MRTLILQLSAILTSFAVAKRGGGGDWRVAFKGRKFGPETLAARHEDIVLDCEAGGSPSPSIHWLKDGVRIQQVLAQFDLIISCSGYLRIFALHYNSLR